MLFSGWLFKAGTTNIYRLAETWPLFLGLLDALARLRTLAYPGLGVSAWLLGGSWLARASTHGLERPTAWNADPT
jgi:hypothetical protein